MLLNCRGNHWIVATTISSSSSETIYVFDSLYTSIDAPTSDLIKRIFNGAPEIVMKDCQKQIGTKDCGLFAIAIATTLASSRDIKHTCNVTYNQSTMRGHLIKCFENYYLSPFP